MGRVCTVGGRSGWFFSGALVVLLCGVLGTLHESIARAEDMLGTAVATPVAVPSGARDGDILSYDAASNSYVLSDISEHEAMYGVVVEDPAFYVTDATIASSSTVLPVVRSGEVIVNVSTLGGDIQPGDLVTSSELAGHGKRADRATAHQALGFALGAPTYDTPARTADVDGVVVRLGRVPVALRIGPVVPGVLTDLAASSSAFEALLNRDTLAQEEGKSIDVFKIFRYTLGASVVLAGMVIALWRFGDMFTQGVVSVGRNPLAKAQVRSVLLWNGLLLLLVSGVGLAIGLTIILLP